jgi:non-ribosomal peptide synthetase component F
VRKTVLDAFSHGEVPVEELKEMNGRFQVEFVLRDTTGSSLKLDDLQVERIRIARGGIAPFLTLIALKGDDGLMVRLAYTPGLLEDVDLSRISEHYRILLESVVADPEQRISELPLPAEAERPPAADSAADARRRGRLAYTARSGGRPTRFRKWLRRVGRRARRAAAQLRTRIKSSPFVR